MGRLRNIVQATLTQQGFEIVAMIVSFVAVPLYLAHLGAERYGLFLTAQAWAGYLAFGSAGISQSTMILVSHASGRNDSGELSRIVRTSLVLSTLGASLVLLVAFVAANALRLDGVAATLQLTNPEAPELVLAVGVQVMSSLVFSTFYDLLIGLQRANHSSWLAGINRLVSQLATLAVALTGGTVGQMTYAGALVTVLVGLVCVVRTRRAHPHAFGTARVTWQQVQLQLRTGAKSFGVQVGSTLTGTAPTLALATMAGPAFVPFYAVPARLLAVGTGIVNSFSALMQPAFGEAYARADMAWIRSALSQVWEKTLLLMAIAAAGLIGVGGPFISAWTANQLQVSSAMLVSVAAAGLMTTALAPVKFLLSGINRHRGAALIEIANGVLAVTLSFVVVRAFSPSWVGFGTVAAAACTSAWMLPMQARLHVGSVTPVRSAARLIKMALCAVAVYGSAQFLAALGVRLAPEQAWVSLLLSVAGAGMTGVVAAVGLNLIEWRELYLRIQRT